MHTNASAKPHWHFAFTLPLLKMKLESCYKIGVIAKPHGLKGEVTILLEDTQVDWDATKSVFVLTGASQLVPYFIENISVRGTKAFLKFEDVDSPELAASISKREIYLPKSERPKSGKGEFYDDEISGFTVTDELNGELGTVEGVEMSGMNRLIVVKNGDKEILIPVNSPFILSINKTRKKISVNLPEGFLDI
jgi:16S rRNA processing protein RimM